MLQLFFNTKFLLVYIIKKKRKSNLSLLLLCLYFYSHNKLNKEAIVIKIETRNFCKFLQAHKSVYILHAAQYLSVNA